MGLGAAVSGRKSVRVDVVRAENEPGYVMCGAWRKVRAASAADARKLGTVCGLPLPILISRIVDTWAAGKTSICAHWTRRVAALCGLHSVSELYEPQGLRSKDGKLP
jgi:hypothetical protein